MCVRVCVCVSDRKRVALKIALHFQSWTLAHYLYTWRKVAKPKIERSLNVESTLTAANPNTKIKHASERDERAHCNASARCPIHLLHINFTACMCCGFWFWSILPIQNQTTEMFTDAAQQRLPLFGPNISHIVRVRQCDFESNAIEFFVFFSLFFFLLVNKMTNDYWSWRLATIQFEALFYCKNDFQDIIITK